MEPLGYYCCRPFRLFRAFYERMKLELGFKALITMLIVYGLNQGFATESGFYAGNYYSKDVLKLSVARAAILNNVVYIPWTIKPLYGVVSDLLPIRGYSRGPYLFYSGCVGAAAFLALALAPGLRFWSAALAFAGLSASVAVPDVLMDAFVAERCRARPALAADLQSLALAAEACGGLLACAAVGPVEARFGPRVLFGITSLAALALLPPSLMNWLGEKPKRKRAPPPAGSSQGGGDRHRPAAACPRRSQVARALCGPRRPLYALAAFVGLAAAAMTSVVARAPDPLVGGSIAVFLAVAVAFSTYCVLSKINIWMAKIAVFMFALNTFHFSLGSAFFYWQTEYDQGPKFSPELMGVLDIIKFISMMVGITVYNRFLSHWRYPKIFCLSQLLLIVQLYSHIFWVLRLNLRVGIPDWAFIFSEEAVGPAVRRLTTVPLYVLAARVCPAGAEGTMFALLMSINNFGTVLQKIFGVGAIRLAGISRQDYTNLPFLYVAKTLLMIVPVLLIPKLVPNIHPSEPVLDKTDEEGSSFASSGSSMLDSLAENMEQDSDEGDINSVLLFEIKGNRVTNVSQGIIETDDQATVGVPSSSADSVEGRSFPSILVLQGKEGAAGSSSPSFQLKARTRSLMKLFNTSKGAAGGNLSVGQSTGKVEPNRNGTEQDIPEYADEGVLGVGEVARSYYDDFNGKRGSAVEGYALSPECEADLV